MENTLSRGGSSTKDSTQTLVIVLAAVVMLVLAGTLIARLTGYMATEPQPSVVVEVRQLGFRDLADGVVEVYDWQTQDELLRLVAGEGSFMRGVVRSLVRQRRGLSESLSVPFLLSRHNDGRLVLSDPATGESIDLVAFGPANSAAFEPLMPGALSRGEGADGSSVNNGESG